MLIHFVLEPECRGVIKESRRTTLRAVLRRPASNPAEEDPVDQRKAPVSISCESPPWGILSASRDGFLGRLALLTRASQNRMAGEAGCSDV